MGYLKVTSSAPRMPANVTALPRAGDVSLRARRSAPTPANAKPHLPRADQLALANIAQRFAPGAGPANAAPAVAEVQRLDSPAQAPQMHSPPITASAATAAFQAPAPAREMRALIVALIVVALLPSALFGAMIWSGAIHMNWSAPWLKANAKTWTVATPASVTGGLVAVRPDAKTEPKPAAESVAAAIQPEPEPRVPATGDPEPKPVKTISVGAPQSKPESASMPGPRTTTEPIAEPETTASIASVGDDASPEALPYDTNLIGVVSWDVAKQDLLGATGVEEVFTTPDETAPPPEHLMRAPEASDDDKNWITAPQFVNLRKGPTSSAAVISVVAKGTKLAVKGRKRGWVQVANPETSESGWIYAGSKARRARRAGETEADGGSSWLGLGSLLGSQ